MTNRPVPPNDVPVNQQAQLAADGSTLPGRAQALAGDAVAEPAAERAVEGAGTLKFRARPCAGERVCPWRRDADLTVYTDEDMRRLIEASQGDTRGGAHSLAEAEQIADGRRMACHPDQPDTSHPLRLCAGWLAVIGPHHFRARLSVLTGQLPVEAIHPDTSAWPPLVDDLDELLERRIAQLAALGLDPAVRARSDAEAAAEMASRPAGPQA